MKKVMKFFVSYGRGGKAHFSIFPNDLLQRHMLTSAYKSQGKPPAAGEVNFFSISF